MKFNLIVPAAGLPKEGKTKMPKIFNLDDEGIMLCVRSILGVNPGQFDNIVFTILKSHVDSFDIDTLLNLQFKRLGLYNARIFILDSPTGTQAETICKTITDCELEGALFIKDADCYFEAEVYPENGVAVCPLESLPLVDPRNKSYVAVDDMQHITNIIEKRIINNLFNAGGYCFGNIEDFLKAYNEYSYLGNIYLSHLIYGMLLSGKTFRPITVSRYMDFSLNSPKPLLP